MKKCNTKGKKFTKKMMAAALCAVLFVTMPGEAPVVFATEENTTATVATETPATAESVNTDANGTLGKNSDVGVEVTKSITGTAGKKIKIAFKLKANDAAKIKLKSVYPVIDTEFPFETSGDAYKIESAGADAAKQAELNAEFSMTARSDIETGYYSVKFIGEYTKIADDGTAKDYYVIKTINIYFKGADFVPASSDSKDDKKDKEDEEDDEDISYPGDYDDSSYSGGGSSSDEEVTAPKLIITGYESEPEKIKSGETFKLKIHIQNTSKKTPVCNAKFLIGNEAGSFLPTSGSSAVFIDSIPAGETKDLEIEMKTSADLAQKNYILVVKGDFDDGKGNNFTSSDNLSIPVYQDVKMAITDVTMTPEVLGVNEQGSLMFTLNNKTGVGVFNVKVSVKDDAATAEESYVGNIAGSATAYATLNLTGVKDNADKGTINVVISYEDADGNAGTIEEQVTCAISENGSSGGMDEEGGMEGDFGEMEFPEDEEEGGIAWWLIVIIVLVAVAVIVGIVVFVILRKKKKEAELLEFDDDDEFGEEDIENEDF